MFDSKVHRERSKLKYSLLLKSDAPYIPAFSMQQPVFKSRRFRFPPGKYNAALQTLLGDAPLDQYIGKTISELNDNKGINYFEEVCILFEEAFGQAISEYLISPEKGDFTPRTWFHSGLNYADLVLSLQFNTWSTIAIRDNHYSTNLMTCAHYNDTGVDFLFVLMVKREHLDYFRLCWLMGETPHPSIFEFWVAEGFDHKDTHLKGLRSVYRKKIKSQIIDAGIEIKEVNNIFNELYHSISIPNTITSISERKQWIETTSQDCLLHLKEKQALEKKFNILIDY